MRVQRVLMPDGAESWTVLDAGGDPVPAVEGFLAHLQALDRSPTTVRTYATSLKLWLQLTRELLDAAGAAGRERQAQNHRTVLVNLDKIIASLQALHPKGADGND